jgi:hypothetical protein
VKPVPWDFTTYAGPDAKGVIGPQSPKVARRLERDLAFARDLIDAGAEWSEQMDGARRAASGLVGGPTVEQLQALPPRVLLRFAETMAAELFS